MSRLSSRCHAKATRQAESSNRPTYPAMSCKFHAQVAMQVESTKRQTCPSMHCNQWTSKFRVCRVELGWGVPSLIVPTSIPPQSFSFCRRRHVRDLFKIYRALHAVNIVRGWEAWAQDLMNFMKPSSAKFAKKMGLIPLRSTSRIR